MTTAIRNRSRARRRPITARLRSLHWGWWIAAAILAAKAAQEWTVQIVTALAVTAAASLAVVTFYSRQNPQPRPARWIPRPRANRPANVADYLALDPTAFEHAITRLAMRDPNVRSAIPQGGSNDRGLDVLVHLRDGRRIAIQCKRYREGNRVGSEHIQILNGTYRDIHRADLGVIVTTSGFTRDALQTNALLAQRLVLVDGPALTAWDRGGPAPWA